MNAALDQPILDDDAVTVGARIGYAGKALLYVALAALVGQMTFRGSSGDTSAKGAIDALARQPMGTAILLLLALGLVAHGGHAAWSAFREGEATWREEFDRHQVSAEEHKIIRRTGQVGHLARAVAYGLVGGFVVFAALTHDPDKGGGLDAVLGEVTQTSFAPFVLVPMAVGMLAYALFAAMMARYVNA